MLEGVRSHFTGQKITANWEKMKCDGLLAFSHLSPTTTESLTAQIFRLTNTDASSMAPITQTIFWRVSLPLQYISELLKQ